MNDTPKPSKFFTVQDIISESLQSLEKVREKYIKFSALSPGFVPAEKSPEFLTAVLFMGSVIDALEGGRSQMADSFEAIAMLADDAKRTATVKVYVDFVNRSNAYMDNPTTETAEGFRKSLSRAIAFSPSDKLREHAAELNSVLDEDMKATGVTPYTTTGVTESTKKDRLN